MSGCIVKSEDDCESEGEDSSRGKEKGGKERESAAIGSNRSKAAASAEDRTQASVEMIEPAPAASGRSAELAAAASEVKASETEAKGEDEKGEESSSTEENSRRVVRGKADIEREKGESGGTRLDPQIGERERDTGRLCRSGQDRAEDNDGETEEKYCSTQIPGEAGGQRGPSEDGLGGVGVRLMEDAKGSLLSGKILIFSYISSMRNPHILTSSYILIYPHISSHPHILTSSYLHILYPDILIPSYSRMKN